ncbi:unnamed protein product, partial [Rotaria socialis]
RAKARKQSHNSSSSGSASLSSVRLSSKPFSTNPTSSSSSSSFHQMFNGRANASTSSPTSIMMTTDPSMFYSTFPP